jgi:RNA recognition motif-containing protein
LTLLANQKAEFPGNEYPIMKIYVSNLPVGNSNASLANLFQPFGVITSVHAMTRGSSGRCRDFGYVDMVREDGECDISKLDREITEGILLRAKEARIRL